MEEHGFSLTKIPIARFRPVDLGLVCQKPPRIQHRGKTGNVRFVPCQTGLAQSLCLSLYNSILYAIFWFRSLDDPICRFFIEIF